MSQILPLVVTQTCFRCIRHSGERCELNTSGSRCFESSRSASASLRTLRGTKSLTDARRPRSMRSLCAAAAPAAGFSFHSVPSFALLGRAIAKHQVREVEIEFVRWDIMTFRQETHVAERAGVDNRLEVFAIHSV